MKLNFLQVYFNFLQVNFNFQVCSGKTGGGRLSCGYTELITKSMVWIIAIGMFEKSDSTSREDSCSSLRFSEFSLIRSLSEELIMYLVLR